MIYDAKAAEISFFLENGICVTDDYFYVKWGSGWYDVEELKREDFEKNVELSSMLERANSWARKKGIRKLILKLKQISKKYKEFEIPIIIWKY